MARRDWTQPVLDLLELLQEQELELRTVSDGFERVELDGDADERRQAAADVICSVDMSWLSIGIGTFNAQLALVLGNEPDEIVCDWSSKGCLEPLIELAIDLHGQQWQGKPCPVTEDHPIAPAQAGESR
jgi:hypothetical protein